MQKPESSCVLSQQWGQDSVPSVLCRPHGEDSRAQTFLFVCGTCVVSGDFSSRLFTSVTGLALACHVAVGQSVQLGFAGQ